MLKPQPTPPVPEATARAARAAFPKGNRYITLRDELEAISKMIDRYISTEVTFNFAESLVQRH